MKQFSPAGMATKGFFGRGARTFGNPDGAVTGGGAWSRGGDNPNGPNQGGGGGGSVPSGPFSGQFDMTASNLSGVQTGFCDGAFDNQHLLGGGSVNPTSLDSSPIGSLWVQDNAQLYFGMYGNHTQSDFQTLSFTDQGGTVRVFNASDAAFTVVSQTVPPAPFGVGAKWIWPYPFGQPFLDANTYTIVINGLVPPGTPVPVTQNFIGASQQHGVKLSDLLTAAGLLTQWNNGTLTTILIRWDGLAPVGYWVISGGRSGNALGDHTANGVGLWVDTAPAGVPVTINIDSSHLRIYGGGGPGGAGNPGVSIAFDGADAVFLDSGLGTTVNVNVWNTIGLHTGAIMGGGGGGAGGLGNPAGNGGGGAAGWNPGAAGAGGGVTVPAATAGGVYDAQNGGTDDPNVAGGTPSGSGGNVGGNGGQLGQAGQSTGLGSGGGAGDAVHRRNTPGMTTIVTGASLIKGVVQ